MPASTYSTIQGLCLCRCSYQLMLIRQNFVCKDYAHESVDRDLPNPTLLSNFYGMNISPFRQPSHILAAIFRKTADNANDIAVASAAPQIPKLGIKIRLSKMFVITLIVNSRL